MKKSIILKSFFVLCALVVGSKSSWGQTDTITFDFEDDGAHRSSGNNSYTSNTYSENSATISMNYFDAIPNTGIGGSYLARGRVAKKTTNNPVLVIGPISITNKTITTISFKTKGNSDITEAFATSTDGSTYSDPHLSFTCPTSTTQKNVSNLTITGTNLYLKWSGSVSSSNSSSNRDFDVDDIVITYSTSGGGDTPTTYSVTYIANGGTGTMTDSNSPYASGATVNLLSNTFTAPSGKVWSSWLVKDASQNTIPVTNNQFTMPASNVTVTAQWADAPTYTITAVSNNDNYGTVALEDNEITATPEDGYRISKTTPYEVTSGTATVTREGNVFTVAATSNCTVRINFEAIPQIAGYNVNFEEDLECYVDWEFTNALIHTGITDVSAHGGSYWATNANSNGNATTTASFQTKEIVAYPDVFKCYVSKESGNTTSSTWKVQVSDNASTWTDVGTQSATSMDKGTWVEFSVSIKNAGYKNKYVRLYYTGSNAFRAVDDISLTTYTPAAVEPPTITVASSFTLSTSVTMNCVTAGASIYYTTNGSTPTKSSTLYEGEFTITSTTNFKAKAFKGDDESEVTEVTATKNLATATVEIGSASINVGATTTVTTNGPAVSLATDDSSIASVDGTTVTGVAAGSTKITATWSENSDYAAGSQEFTVTVVDPNAPGAENNPYTVGDALTAIAALSDNGYIDSQYVKGIISRVGSLSSGALTYWISADGNTSSELQVYKGKDVDGASFTATTDLTVGDGVVIKGQLKKYVNGNATTPEFNSNSQIVSLAGLPQISPAAGAVVPGSTVTITSTEGATIYYTMGATPADPTTGSSVHSEPIEINAATTIKAIAVKGGQSTKVVSAAYTIITNTVISVDPTSLSGFSYVKNNGPSAAKTISVAGGNLTANLTLSLGNSSNYEMSTSENSGYTNSLSLTPTDGTVSATTIYVRLKAGLEINNSYNGTITLSSTDAEDATVNLSGSVIAPDYATLPFSWAGGSSSDFEDLDGVTVSGKGSDYSAKDHSPYLIKLDGTGDYIQIKTDSQPGRVSIGVKMIGGATTSTITVQESEDGESFSNVEDLTISGSQHAKLTLNSTKEFNPASRYVRLYFTKGSNVGVGAIKIAAHPESGTILNAANHVQTFYDSSKNYELSEGALAYTAGLVSGTVVFYRIGANSNIIPKNTAVVIISSSEISLTEITTVPEGTTVHAGNILVGTDSAIDQPAGSTVYVLGNVGNVLGFYKLQSDIQIPAHKAYYVKVVE